MARTTKTRRQRQDTTYQAAQATAAARILGLLGHEMRLMALYHLTIHKEMRVNDIVDVMNIKQAAVSQHLAKLRKEGLVTFRRDSQSLYYRIADSRVPKLFAIFSQNDPAKHRRRAARES